MAESIISHRARRGSSSRSVLAVEPGPGRTTPRASAAPGGGFGILGLIEDKKVFQGMRGTQKCHDDRRQTWLAIRSALAILSSMLATFTEQVRS